MSEWEDLPECPKCGESEHDWWDGAGPNLGDGSVLRICCANCDTDYEALMCIDTTFQSSLPDHEPEREGGG